MSSMETAGDGEVMPCSFSEQAKRIQLERSIPLAEAVVSMLSSKSAGMRMLIDRGLGIGIAIGLVPLTLQEQDPV